MSAQRRLYVALLLLLGVLVVGSAGYLVIEAEYSPTVLEALYMTVITVSTVGFTEVWPMSPAARVWTIGVIAVGIAGVSYAFTSLVQLAVSGELRTLRERIKMEHTIEQMQNHIILCGYGRMGAMVVDELRRLKVSVVVVEIKREAEEILHEKQVPFVIGDATDEPTLTHAGLMRARAMIVALPSDADSVFITLSAHALRPDLNIIARAEHPSAGSKLKRAGATRVICPQEAGAMRVVNLITRPTVVDFVDLANRGVDLEIDEYVIGPTSALAGHKLRDAPLRRETNATVVAIKRADGKAIFSPDADAVLSSGDTLILVGPAGISSRLRAI